VESSAHCTSYSAHCWVQLCSVTIVLFFRTLFIALWLVALVVLTWREQCPASSTTSECLTSGVCVGVSQVRSRPRYAIDKDKDVTECRHSFVSGSHGSQRTGGIFTWFCRHGICYGFYIIPNAQGRNEALSFLLKHFKVAPNIVVYDFACALQDYCMNRQPAHFKDSMFLVDRFHWFNHMSCARSYNVSMYAE